MLVRFRKAQEERESGFTLIELLVVVIIIGILAAIAIPIFLNQRKSAVTAGVESDVRNIATNVETAATAANGAYPASITGALTAGATGVISVGNNAVFKSDAQTVISYATKTGGFTVCGYNANSNASATGTAILYDSTLGGIQTGYKACP